MVEAKVAIILGSKSDMPIAEKIEKVLDDNGVQYDLQVLSAHRTPDKLDECLRSCRAKVIIAVAGLSAALPGVVASKTKVPVIGVPVSAKLGGMDALLSIVQMPPGIPVATVGIDNGENAALLAMRILGIDKK